MTLTELVITIALVGIVVTVLASATIVFLRNQDDTTTRVDRTRGLQQLVNYFPADSASAQRIETAPPWTQPCLSLGAPVLNLVWSETFPGSEPETVAVTYVRSPDGRSLIRNECGPEPQTETTVARGISNVVADVSSGPSEINLVLDFDGTQHIISGNSRNH